MSTSPESQTMTKFRTRRTHQKSRNGCFECKRRKVKCDELKPSCGRCNTMLQKCSYPPASLYMSASGDQRNESCQPSPPFRMLFPFPNSASYLERSLSPEVPIHSPYGLLEVDSKHCYHVENAALRLSDVDLYQHYMEHTSRATKYSQVDQMIIQIGIPKLALRNKTVFHSLLALSAVCLGCDMISRDPPPDLTDVNQVLMIGYRHYNLASEKLRELISQLDGQKVEPLIASNMLLVPFSPASQQLHHWVSRRSGGTPSGKLLCSTPRDFIVIMRGFRTILQALGSPESRTVPESPEDAELDRSVLSGSNIVPVVSTTMPTHAMFPILATTSQEAFSQLQSRLDLAKRNAPDARYLGDPLSACVAAFEVLDLVRIAVFSMSNPPALRAPTNKDRKPLVLKSVWPPQVVPWLRGYAIKPALPSPMRPLTRMLLAFVVQVPQAYFDIVLPLLEQRLETDIAPSPPDAARQLTAEQALALDIYAYWSVLMFLIENESWWVGSLPVVTLDAMIDRFGDEFVATQWPEQDFGRDRWWPGIMLTVLKEINRR